MELRGRESRGTVVTVQLHTMGPAQMLAEASFEKPLLTPVLRVSVPDSVV